MKFTDPGGRITIALRMDGEGVAIDVTDTGIGIPANTLEAVFEPFVQVGRALSNPGEGTGLGLAIAKRFVEQNGGRLEITSRRGAGTTVRVWLPAVASDETPEAERTPVESAARSA